MGDFVPISSEATTKLDLVPAESGVRRVGLVDVGHVGASPTAKLVRQIRRELARRGKPYAQYLELRGGVWRASATIAGVEVAYAARVDGPIAHRQALAALLFDLMVSP